MPRSTFFEGLTQESHPTSAGVCPLPILYEDASMLGAFYRVERERAGELLRDTPFEPLPVLGKATVLLVGFEYRQTSVGVYNEIGLAVMAARRGSKPSTWSVMRDMRGAVDTGLYVVNLPVTTKAAWAAGREILGYPKYVTGIETYFGDDGAARLGLENEFELTVGRARGIKTGGIPFITWTVLDDRLIRTVIEVDHKLRWGGSRSAELTLLGDGPTADSLRVLGLEGRRPSMTFRTNAMRSILPAGVDMGPAEAAEEARSQAA